MFDIFNNADNESSLIQLMADYQNGDITKEEILVQQSSCYAETDEDDDNRISSEDEDPVPVRKSAREPKPKKPRANRIAKKKEEPQQPVNEIVIEEPTKREITTTAAETAFLQNILPNKKI